MEIKKTQALNFMKAVKQTRPDLIRLMCEVQERCPLGDKLPIDCNDLNDTDYADSSKCDAGTIKWFLDKMYKGEHPNVLSLAFYQRNGLHDWVLYDHIWVDNCKEQFELFLNGSKFKTQTTSI
jgi:hypothetical protein